VGQQRFEPARLGATVGVDEGHERGRHGGQAGVARRRGTAVDGASNHHGPRCSHWRLRAIVDHHDGTDRSEGVEHVAHVAVAHGDHDRHVGDGERAALGTRMDGTGVEQAFGEPL